MPNTTRRVTPWGELSHPRGGFHFADLPESTRESAEEAMSGLSSRNTEIAGMIGERHAKTTSKIAEMRKTGQTVPTKVLRHQEMLARGMEMAEGGLPDTGMDASVKRIRDTAMAPIKAVRQHARKTGEMLPVNAGMYYTGRNRIGREIANRTMGAGTEEARRLELSIAPLSARTGPQQEVSGGAGMGAILRGGEDVRFNLDEHAARFLSTQMKGAKSLPPIEHGPTNMRDLVQTHPDAAVLLLQHGATKSGIIVPKGRQEKLSASKKARDSALSAGANIEIPDYLAEPTRAFLGSLGVSGYPKGARAMSRFYSDPNDFGGFDFHKIPSYTWDIDEAGDRTVALGTRHVLGALAHGDKWFEAHPDAETHIRRGMARAAWHDPTTTVDAWAARAASGLPFDVANALGEGVNPEKIMSTASMSVTKRGGGYALGNRADVGYLYGEEAHRQAAQSMRVRLPSGGYASPPVPVTQSLSWFGTQGEAYPEQVRSGEKTLVPRSMSDPRGLNSLRLPKTW